MTHFASELNPQNNNELQRIQGANEWVNKQFDILQEMLGKQDYGVPVVDDGAFVVEYRFVLGVDWMFERRSEHYRRLEWRCLAAGWNAARGVCVQGQGVIMRCFSFLEPIMIHVIDSFPFALTFDAPEELKDVKGIGLEELIRSVSSSGTWRYSAHSREYIPSHRILSVDHSFLPKTSDR